MELSLLGETVLRPDNVEVTYTGFWMPRGGDEGTFTIDISELTSASTFQLEIQTKNSEDADSSVTIMISPTTLTGTGATKLTGTGAKEWVRYVVRGVEGAGNHRMHFQFLEPQWTPN